MQRVLVYLSAVLCHLFQSITDDAVHLCVPSMDGRGKDSFAANTYKDNVCGEVSPPDGWCRHVLLPAVGACTFPPRACSDTLNMVAISQICVERADCNYFITTADDPETGVCYAKNGFIPFSMGDNAEYPDTGGMTRYDLVG